MEELVLLRPTAYYAEQLMECKKEYLAANSSMDGCGPMRRTDDSIEYIEKCALEENPETCPAPLVPASLQIWWSYRVLCKTVRTT